MQPENASAEQAAAEQEAAEREEKRRAAQAEAEHIRAGKAAKADNGIDFVPADNVHGSLHTAQQHPRQREFAPQAFATHAFHRHRFQGNAVLRHQALFHAARAAEPHDFVPHLLQRLRHGQCGENVPAGAACHH